MKKLFAILAIFGIMSVGLSSVLLAQEATPAEQTEQVVSAPVDTQVATVQETSNGGFHQALKTKSLTLLSLCKITEIIDYLLFQVKIIFKNSLFVVKLLGFLIRNL